MNDPVYGLSVRQTGARGDGQCDDAPAIQKALDSARGLVTAPPGRYRIGRTLRVPSRTRLVAHERAVLTLADGAGADQWSFLLANADPRGGDRDIEIAGGIWDGNCAANPRGPDRHGAYTGVLANFIKVTGLTLRGMTFVDPESYYLRLGEVRRFVVEHVAFEARTLRPNQDGVHLGGGCEDGIIRHIRGVGQGVPSDDLVAFNADDALGRAQNLDMICGPIRRVVAHDLAADSCHTFVRLLSTVSEIDEVDIELVRGGCRVAMLNADACARCRVPVYDPADPRLARGVGRIGRVRVSDVRVHKVDPRMCSALVDLECDAADLEIRSFERDAERDACPNAPTLLVDDVSPRELVIEGLDESQALELRHEAPAEAAMSRMPRPAEPQADACAARRLTARLTRDSHLELPRGGFERLILRARAEA